MKYIIKITLGLVLCAGFVTSCKDDDEPGIDGITVDKEEITIGAEGGTEKIAVSSNTQWVTRASEPWIAISPANGIGSAVCDLAIDSDEYSTYCADTFFCRWTGIQIGHGYTVRFWQANLGEGTGGENP